MNTTNNGVANNAQLLSELRSLFDATPILLGATIRARREMHGWNIAELAEAVQVASTTIADLESGAAKTANDAFLDAIAAALGIPTADLRLLCPSADSPVPEELGWDTAEELPRIPVHASGPEVSTR